MGRLLKREGLLPIIVGDKGLLKLVLVIITSIVSFSGLLGSLLGLANLTLLFGLLTLLLLLGFLHLLLTGLGFVESQLSKLLGLFD